MNIGLIIKVVGIVCWLLHSRFWTKVCDADLPAVVGDDGSELTPHRVVEKWMCRKCDKTWEVPK